MLQYVPQRFESSFRAHMTQITSLAVHLCPKTPSEWPDWPASCMQALERRGASLESLLDLLTIVGEEIETADLLPPQK